MNVPPDEVEIASPSLLIAFALGQHVFVLVPNELERVRTESGLSLDLGWDWAGGILQPGRPVLIVNRRHVRRSCCRIFDIDLALYQKPAKTDLTWTNNEPEKNAGPNAGDIVGLTYYKRRFAPNRCL